MSIKVRFAILITFFVSLILITSFTSIYILYYNYRESDFYDRVEAEGKDFEDFVNTFKDPKVADEVKIIKGLHNNTLWDECLAVLDSNGNVINVLPDSFNYKASPAFLQKIRQRTKIQFKDRSREMVAKYNPVTRNYIISSGYDISGIDRLRNLRNILLLVFFFAIIITIIISFSFVSQLLKPLTRLSNQIKHVNEARLAESVDDINGKDEIAEISKNFNSLLKRLNSAFQSQKTFVHHASHELRTPLATMYAQTEAALKKDLSIEEYRTLLLSLKEDQTGVIELTNSLLLLSQYEKLNKSDNWPEIRIDELIYDASSLIKKTFFDADIVFSFERLPDNENDITLKGNEALLISAFANLIKNGYLYSIDKKIIITISYTTLHIIINFDTIGEPVTSTITELTTPFFRGQNTQNIKGFGLGLSIVDRIIKLHNGMILYNQLLGKINRFSIQLPKTTHS